MHRRHHRTRRHLQGAPHRARRSWTSWPTSSPAGAARHRPQLHQPDVGADPGRESEPRGSRSSACATACSTRRARSRATWRCRTRSWCGRCAGINHNAWFTRLETLDGEDLYRGCESAPASPKGVRNDPVRFEVMLQLGAFVTESSGHFSEYVSLLPQAPRPARRYTREDFLGGSLASARPTSGRRIARRNDEPSGGWSTGSTSRRWAQLPVRVAHRRGRRAGPAPGLI